MKDVYLHYKPNALQMKGDDPMDEFLAYEEVEALEKGDQILVFLSLRSKLYHHGTVVGKGTLAGGPSLWIHFEGQPATVSTNIATGMQFTKEFWSELPLSRKFRRVSVQEEADLP